MKDSFIWLVKVETFLDYDKSSQGVVFTTDRPYEPGEQVNTIRAFYVFFTWVQQRNLEAIPNRVLNCDIGSGIGISDTALYQPLLDNFGWYFLKYRYWKAKIQIHNSWYVTI